MKSDAVFLIIIVISIFAITWINNNLSFIGRHKKLGIISLMAMLDLLVMYINTHIFFIVKTDSFSQTASVLILSAFITICVLGYTFLKALKVIGERKMEVSTLVNCRLYNRTIYYKLQGMSLQGAKNTFILFCKDGKDFAMAMNNGVNSFNIRYFTSTKRIESVTFMPNGVNYSDMNKIVNDSIANQEIKKKKK